MTDKEETYLHIDFLFDIPQGISSILMQTLAYEFTSYARRSLLH